MRPFRIACLILFLGAAVASCAEPVPQFVAEFWETAHLDGVKIGTTHTTVHAVERDGGKVNRTAFSFDLALRRGNALLKLRIEEGCDETADGKVIAVSMKQIPGQGPALVLNGALDDGRMHVQIDGGRIDRRLRWSDEIVGLYRRDRLFADKKPKPGDRFAFPAFDPEVNAVVTYRAVVKGTEEINLPAGRKSLQRVDLVPDRLEGPGFSVQRPTQVVWLDDAFVPVRRQIEMDGLGSVILTRSTREAATAPSGEPPDRLTDINSRNIVPLNRAIPRVHSTRAVVYRVTLRDDPDPATAFVSDAHQEVKSVRGQSFELHVHPVRPTTPGKTEAPGAEFLASSHFIDSDAAAVRDAARLAAAGERDPWRKALRIERWVKANMRPDNTVSFVPASQVARDLRGDCRQYALLTAALCRAEGIPARTALGLVYVDKPGQRSSLGFHMWAEVWIDGRWLGIDGTLGLGGVGAGHVKITDHSWHDTPSQTPLLPASRVLGKMTIEVLSVESGD
jgi:transglutaminase-like putative cysteine protease